MILGYRINLQRPTKQLSMKLILYYYLITFICLTTMYNRHHNSYNNDGKIVFVYGKSMTPTSSSSSNSNKDQYYNNLTHHYLQPSSLQKQHHHHSFLQRLMTSFTDLLQQQSSIEPESTITMKDMTHHKLGSTLSSLVEMYNRSTNTTSSTTTRISDASSYSSSNVKVMNDNTVLVDVIGNGIVDDMANELDIDGYTTVRVINCYKHMCSMYIPIDKLQEIANLPYIQFISSVQNKANAGRVTTEGDIAMYTDDVRATYNVDGSGLLICVLSDSFDCLGNAQEDINTGDLPPIVNFSDDYFSNDDLPPAPSSIVFINDLTDAECVTYDAQDEGRSMMQIIHDIAPGALLGFRTAYRGQADFAAGIKELAYDYRCDIIVDDVTYFEEPFFQDGMITQAVDEVVTEVDLLYFAAVGNAGRNSWEEPYGFYNSTVRGGPFNRYYHAFAFDRNGAPIIYQGITIPNIDENITFIFQWSEPYASATCTCSSNKNQVDLDIFFTLLNTTSGVYETIVRGADYNVGKDPIEIVSFNPRSAIKSNADFITIYMYIQIYEGSYTNFMKVIAVTNYTSIDVSFEFGSDDGASTNFGHANSRFGASVGAANYNNTPAFGVSPPVIESFSTLGGTPIFFDEIGSALLTTGGRRLQQGQQRRQPRFVGPDGVSTTFKYKPPRKRFSGTSAAAPHVAGNAALLLEATSGTMSASEIFSLLQGSAIDMNENGFDFSSGSGFVDSMTAFEFANVPIPPPSSCGLFGLSIFCLCGCGLFKRILGIGGC